MKNSIENISKHMIYELIDGKPILYKGLKSAQTEFYNDDSKEVMGSSFLQSYIITQLVILLNNKLAKTQQLLDFGVKKVIWIFTDSQKILVAAQNKDWVLSSWYKKITLLKDTEINISELIKDID